MSYVRKTIFLCWNFFHSVVKTIKSAPVETSLSSGISTSVSTTSVGAQAPPSRFRRDWPWGLILILFVIAAYTPVWKAGFVRDDESILTANPCIVGPLGLKEIWTTPAADICR
jgi:hypothetical protein